MERRFIVRNVKLCAAMATVVLVAIYTATSTTTHLHTSRTILQHPSCQQATQQGQDYAQFFNYYSWTYCSLHSLGVVFSSCLFVILLFLTMSMLGTTADYFLVPQLESLSVKLSLSPNIAGLTLIALGNAAPDVFTNISAVLAHDVEIVLGELLGASVLLVSLCLGLVVLVSKQPMMVQRQEFLRDLIAFLGVQFGVLLVTIDGEVYLYEAFIIIGIYIAYIIVAVILARRSSAVITLSENSIVRGLLSEHDAELSCYDSDKNDVSNDDSDIKIEENINEDWADADESVSEEPLMGLKLSKDKMSNVQILTEYPFTLLRWLSIPGGDGEWGNKRRVFLVLSPTFVILLFLLCIGVYSVTITSFNVSICALAPIAGVPLSLLLHRLIPKDSRKPAVADLLGFICSIMWLYLVANECVALLQTIGLIFNVPSSLLAISVLAIGNSIGDLVADTAVARRYPAAGVAACFGAPLLSTLLGLGLSFLIACISKGTYSLEVEVKKVIIPWISLIVILLVNMGVFISYSYSPPRQYGYVLIAFYIAFMGVSLYSLR